MATQLNRLISRGAKPGLSAGLMLGAGTKELERVSSHMFGGAAPSGLAHEAVRGIELAFLSQGWPVGRPIGALPEVQKQLGLGRPASREAVTILEARGLLDVRRGPGGGLFVGAPVLEDVASAVLMFLALGGTTRACIVEFRLLVWRMIVNAAMQRGYHSVPANLSASEVGFAAGLAEHIGNNSMALLARLSELLVVSSQDGSSASTETDLCDALSGGDLRRVFKRIDELVATVEQDAPVVSMELAERGFSLAGRKSAMALAAMLARELSCSLNTQEAEWETGDRLGYTDAVVRQARRILQDFGIVQCRQGRKGAELAPPSAPTGLIRQLAPCVVASADSELDLWEIISSLAASAPVLAARRIKAGVQKPVSFLPSPDLANACEVVTSENLLLELSGNPLLAIVVRSLGVAHVFLSGDALGPKHEGEIIAINGRILQAVERGDVSAAGVLARTKLNMMHRPWESEREVA